MALDSILNITHCKITKQNVVVFITFHPILSKNVANLDCPVVFPPHGPPVRTSLYTRRSGRPPLILIDNHVIFRNSHNF